MAWGPLERTLPADAPNRFLVNIQTDQIEQLRDYFSQHGRVFPALYPMVRGRLVAINGEAVVADDYLDERAKRFVNRERRRHLHLPRDRPPRCSSL